MVNVAAVRSWSLMDALNCEGSYALKKLQRKKIKLIKFSWWPVVLVLFRSKTGWWKAERRRKSGDIPQWLLGNCL